MLERAAIRRRWCWRAVAAVVCAAVIGAGGCRKQSAEPNAANEQVVLTYWCSTAPAEVEAAREAVAQWNASRHDVMVNVQPIPASQSSEEVLLAAVAAGTTPDICSNIWPGAIADLIDANGLVAMDQFTDFNDVVRERMGDNTIDAFISPDGRCYQLPWKTNPIMLLYNTKIFREEGITELPRTYSQYMAVAKKVTRDTDGDGRIDRWVGTSSIQPIWWHRIFDYYSFYVRASGGKTLFDENRVAFDNAASVKVFAFFRELYQKKYFPLTAFQGDPFVNGKIATLPTGPWHITYVEKNKQPGFEFDVIPLPVPDDYNGPVCTYGSMKSITIFKTTRHPRQAWEFAKFLVNRENDYKVLAQTSQIPVRKNLFTDPLFAEYLKSHPQLAKFASFADAAKEVDANANLKEVLDAIAQEYEACVIYGAKTPEQAINDAAERAKIIVKWNEEAQ